METASDLLLYDEMRRLEGIRRRGWMNGICPRCSLNGIVHRDNRAFCLFCGTVYTLGGEVLGWLKSWDNPNIHDLTHEPPGERFR